MEEEPAGPQRRLEWRHSEVADDDLQEIPPRTLPSQSAVTPLTLSANAQRATCPLLPAESRLALEFHRLLAPCGYLSEVCWR